MKNKRIAAIQLLNDFNDSSFVLQQALEVLKKENEVHLFTGTASGKGFLSNSGNINRHHFFYRTSNGKAGLLFFLLSQTVLFFKLLRFLKKGDTVYINTLLPAAAAIAGRLKKCRVIYHVHDVQVQPLFLKKLLLYIADNCAHEAIAVSAHTAASCTFKKATITVVHNTLPLHFSLPAAGIVSPNLKTPFTVSMFCSPGTGNGIDEFIRIAAKMPRIRFILAMHAPEKTIARFRKDTKPTLNCRVIALHENTLPVHKQSHLVINLSASKEHVETFGLTILQAMSCGRPVIVPPVAGMGELVEHGVEGFCLSAANESSIITAINRLSSDVRMYNCFAAAAREKALCFPQQKFILAVNNRINSPHRALTSKKIRAAVIEDIN